MKKILCVVAAALALTSGMFAQVMKSNGIKNTLSTGLGNTDGNTRDDNKSAVDFKGFLDTFQIRYDLSKFTVESMLTWGMDYNDEKDGYLQFGCHDYYVNFFVHPIEGMDIGAGTRLNWYVGKAPNAGSSWMPLPHVIQGDLDDHYKPEGGYVAGFASYANTYSSPLYYKQKELRDAAIGIRYAYGDLFQLGLTIPNMVTTNDFYVNAAFQINPIDMLSLSVAYRGIGRANSDLYIGGSLYFNNLSFDLYFAANFRSPDKGTNNTNNIIGWGVASTISIPKIGMTLRPELGFTDYLHPDYSFAWYIGNRMDIQFADNMFDVGLWISFANGALDKKWADYNSTKDWDGGQIFNITPDITWNINKRHSLSLAYDYYNRKTSNNVHSDKWQLELAWTYRY